MFFFPNLYFDIWAENLQTHKYLTFLKTENLSVFYLKSDLYSISNWSKIFKTYKTLFIFNQCE